MKHAGAALLLALAARSVDAAIVLDGRLDEPEWQQAQRLTGFRTTEPYTRAEPELATTVLIHSDADGLYFGFICDQPPAVARVRSKGQRDQPVAGDRVNLMLDLDGSGATGYEFTAYLGGQYADAIISRQVNYNYDWDGDWQYAAAETPTQWFVEYRLPWHVAPMAAPRGGKLKLGVFVSRVVAATGRRYSLPDHAFARASFVADMREVEVAAFGRAQLDVIPYAAASHDVVREDGDVRAGVDVFWKPSGQHQITASINPDFGQVEADQLVVNFSAIPTFFPDKRPFFTENLDLFSTAIYVLYTRRIGAAPDAGPAGASNIQGALKYTGTSGDLAYGLVTAWEDDASQAQGRDFYVGRLRYKIADALTVGWIGTHVDRPALARRADVQGLDFDWTPAPGVTVLGQGVALDVDHAAPTLLDPAGAGYGGRLEFRYAPGGRLDNTTVVASKPEAFNINDAGFMSRTNHHFVQSVTDWWWRDFAADSAAQDLRLRGDVYLQYNDSGDRLPAWLIALLEQNRRDTSFVGLEYDNLTIGGVDDILTRGNGPVRLPPRHWLFPYYGNRRSGVFRYVVVGGFGTGYWSDGGWYHLKLEPGLYPSDTLSLTAQARFTQSPDEILWQGGSLVGAFDYHEQIVAIDVNWFPVPRHELRAKFQWIAASGSPLEAYRPDPQGHLVATADPLSPFSFTTTAAQLRYRYELAPLSELFVVYSHGGADALAEPQSNLGASLRRGLAEETDSQFLVKLRYRFAVPY